MARLALSTIRTSPVKALVWSGLLASTVLLASWFNAIATTTVEHADMNEFGRDDTPCYMFLTPSPHPAPNPCEP